MTALLHLLLAAALLLAAPASAAPFPRAAIPDALRPWIDWVLHGHEDAFCATLHGNAERRQCAWPSQLRLEVDDGGGRFRQEWTLYRDAWVSLPGNDRLWPQRVEADGRPAAVICRDGFPGVRLEKGRHVVGGNFTWTSLPEMLPVPPATGIVSLHLRGEVVPFPDRDSSGRIWLQRRATEAEENDLLEVNVHRLVSDDIPLLLFTRVDLKVAGKGREVLLGKALPEGFVPMALDSPLPARIEADHHLRLQVRAGRWQLGLNARYEGPATGLTLPAANGDWDEEEVWVFQAQSPLRVVSVEGADSIDPQQTELPEEWRQLPAYLMRPGATMKLVERRRGDADPAPDQLSLERTLWLDFDGGGYTLHDRITGTLKRSWRLEMASPARLGRVAVGGQDQFITRLADTAGTGVEVRQGKVEIDADARLPAMLGDLPAVSWNSDFQSAGGQLHLPPGWRLFTARGADDAEPTWVTAWTLFDLFVVLIIALAMLRLWGLIWGIVALLALGLTFIEPGAPRWIWLAVLAVEGLVRVLPPGRLLRLARLTRIAVAAALVILAVPFMVQQARQGLHPSLERPLGRAMLAGLVGAPPPSAPMAQRGVVDEMEDLAEGEPDRAAKLAMIAPRYRSQPPADPKAVVQTGPGLPAWAWTQVRLRWQGPVERNQRVQLLLMPPWLNRLLAFARMLLLALLLARIILPVWPRETAGAAALLLLSLAVGNARALADDLPPKDLLDELRQRLIEPADCHPFCASLSRMRLEVFPAMLRARLAAHAAADTAIPLPGTASQWLPAMVLVDDQPAATLMQEPDGSLWLHLAAGEHEILLQGALPNRDTVQVALPLKPHRVEVESDGWTVAGLHEDGLADDTLQLSRLASKDGSERAPLQPGTLPPFVRVERTLRLLLSWQVETRVLRLTPPGTGIVLEIPLLPGESVTTADVRVAGGKAQLNLAPSLTEMGWQSTLAEAPLLHLQAPEVSAWAETWIVDASPIWHLETEGIPAVHQPTEGYHRVREWRPWASESVTLRVTRPEGIPGQTLTIDRSAVTVAPGRRATDVTVTLAARSSRGTQHVFALPEHSLLQAISINGVSQPLRQEGRLVTVPIVPGRQEVEITFRQERGIRRTFTTPEVDLGTDSVNTDLQVAMPADRWTLFVSGPSLGPAVLFWSNLVVVLLAAVALGRVSATPLRTRHWFLLGVGLTQVPVSVALVVVSWPLALAWRRRRQIESGPWLFNLTQLLLLLWTTAALAGLLWAIEQGLLGSPEMQISGYASHAGQLHWYADRSGPQLPRATVVSAPMLVYRLLMLAWALWIAEALLRWLRWGWECFSAGGYWRPVRPRLRRADA
jgi:hypothetical protein